MTQSNTKSSSEQIWRSEILSGSAGLHPFRGSRGDCISSLFRVLEAPGFLGSHINATSDPLLTSPALTLTLQLPLTRTLMMTLAPPLKSQDHLPISRFLITSAKSPLRCRETQSHILGVGTGTPLGTTILPTATP